MKYIEPYNKKTINDVLFDVLNIHGTDDGTEKFFHVYSFNCSDMGISSLDGIERLPNLKELNCSYNNLSNLSGLEFCKDLKELQCQNNKITDISAICGLDLVLFNIGENLLSEMNCVFKMKSLKTLGSMYNPWKIPLPLWAIKKFGLAYDKKNYDYFGRYDVQEEILDENPFILDDLTYLVDVDPKLIEKYKDVKDFQGK
jgi:Leucine-rich repeat (LRR) protein